MPYVYNKWILEGEMYPKRRQNLVAILINSRNQNGENGTLVGFKSLYFMDEGRIVLESAFRIASGTISDFDRLLDYC